MRCRLIVTKYYSIVLKVLSLVLFSITNGLGPARNFCVRVKEIINLVFGLGILASSIDLKADLEGPSSLRYLFLDRSNSPFPNMNTHFLTRTKSYELVPVRLS